MRDLKLLKPIDRRFLREYIKNGGNKTQAAAKVKKYNLKDNDQYHAAASWGVDAYKRIQPSIEEEMDAAGISINLLMETLKQGLKAVRVIRDKDGMLVTLPDAVGNLIPQLDPDFRTRHLYMDSGFKLRGAYAAQKHEISGDVGVSAALIVPPEMTPEDWEKTFGSANTETETDKK